MQLASCMLSSLDHCPLEILISLLSSPFPTSPVPSLLFLSKCQLSPTSLRTLLQWTNSGFCYFFQTLYFAIILDSHVIVRPSGEISSILLTHFPSVIYSIESQLGCWYWNTSPALFEIHQFHMLSCLCVCMPAQACVSVHVCISFQATSSHMQIHVIITAIKIPSRSITGSLGLPSYSHGHFPIYAYQLLAFSHQFSTSTLLSFQECYTREIVWYVAFEGKSFSFENSVLDWSIFCIELFTYLKLIVSPLQLTRYFEILNIQQRTTMTNIPVPYSWVLICGAVYCSLAVYFLSKLSFHQ